MKESGVYARAAAACFGKKRNNISRIMGALSDACTSMEGLRGCHSAEGC